MTETIEAIKTKIWDILPDEMAIRLQYHRPHGRFPDLKNPKTLTEKIQVRKLLDRDPRLPVYADKVKAKQMVSPIIGSSHIIPTLWHGYDFDTEVISALPRPFVIKANHGCEANIFIHVDETIDWEEVRIKTWHWMRTTYGRRMREWLYTEIEPQILVEPMIGDGINPPSDYKFFVFHGRVECVHVDIGRFSGQRVRAILDRDWNRLPVRCHHPNAPFEVERPHRLTEMKWIAEKIGAHWDFVRVDLYDVDEHIWFGETTFYPASGYLAYDPESYDAHLGSLWKQSYA